jgi:hypothetical protein
LDVKWVAEMRGESGDTAGRRRDATIQKAQELLSCKALDAMLGGQHFGDVWAQVVAVLGNTDLVPAAQFRHSARGEHQRALGIAVRELLYGSALYEQRFSRYLGAFASAFGQHAPWEVATVLSALVHPKEHICVDAASLRKQLKTFSSRGSIATQPNAAGYTRLLSVARLIANKLAERGEVPRDLLDVRDFICFTLKPASKARAARVKPKAPAVSEQQNNA